MLETIFKIHNSSKVTETVPFASPVKPTIPETSPWATLSFLR